MFTSTEALTNRERLALFHSKRNPSAQKPSARKFWLEFVGGLVGLPLTLIAALALSFAIEIVMGVNA